MAIYVAFEPAELTEICLSFGLGKLGASQGVPQGSINTNYKLETETGRYFLRHTAVRSSEDLEFEAALLSHLSEGGFPVPRVVRTAEGRPFIRIREGWVNVFTYVAGEELTRAEFNYVQSENLGGELGKLHRATNSFDGERKNPYGPETVSEWLAQLAQRPERELREIAGELRACLLEVTAGAVAFVPRGVIHADLFMDNVKWLGERVSAFFDFEMACRDTYTLDVAITLNAWCFNGAYQPELCSAFIRGYQRERPLSQVEREDLFFRALFGAVRYTASRIRDFHLSPLPADRLARKDFRTYLARVRALKAMGPKGFQRLLGLT